MKYIHYKGLNSKPASVVYNNGLADYYYAMCGKRVNQLHGPGKPWDNFDWSYYEPEVTCPACNKKLSEMSVN